MRKTLYKMVFAVAIGVIFNPAQAELFVNPVTKNKIGAGEVIATVDSSPIIAQFDGVLRGLIIHFGTSSVEYEAGGATGDIDRTFLGATYAHGLNSSFDVYGTFSLTLESELEFSSSDGDGYIIGGSITSGIFNVINLTNSVCCNIS